MSRWVTLGVLAVGVVALLVGAIPSAVPAGMVALGWEPAEVRTLGPRVTVSMLFWSLGLLAIGFTGLFRSGRVRVAWESYRTAVELVAHDFGARVQEGPPRHLGFRCVQSGTELAVELDLRPDGGVRVLMATPRPATLEVRAHGVEPGAGAIALIQGGRGTDWTLYVDGGLDARELMSDTHVTECLDALFDLRAVRILRLGTQGAMVATALVEPADVGRVVQRSVDSLTLLAGRTL